MEGLTHFPMGVFQEEVRARRELGKGSRKRLAFQSHACRGTQLGFVPVRFELLLYRG